MSKLSPRRGPATTTTLALSLCVVALDVNVACLSVM
jgi:hypothetical protein